MRDRRPETLAVHPAATPIAAGFHGTSPPIETSSAFVADSVERLYRVFEGQPGAVYSRVGNPTVAQLEHAVAGLEGARSAVAFGSGMAAIHAAWLAAGAERDALLLCSRDCYGSSLRLLDELLGGLGVRGELCDLSDTEAACRRITEHRPRVVHCELVSNPLLRVVELDALAAASQAVGARLVVDATFTPPLAYRALSHGADLVVHSATKYLAGHGDVIGGVVACNDAALEAGLLRARSVAGAVLGPFAAWLTLRGMRTLALRYPRQVENAVAVARWLADQPQVQAVHHPALPGHPHHQRAAAMLGELGCGAIVAFELAHGSRERAFAVMEALQLVQPATTLGDVASLMLYPAASSHRELSAAERAASGIGDGLLRLSLGIEHVDDVIADLSQALEAAS
jgi:cystathionine gamma-synthase/methionine-gamma-lyase